LWAAPRPKRLCHVCNKKYTLISLKSGMENYELDEEDVCGVAKYEFEMRAWSGDSLVLETDLEALSKAKKEKEKQKEKEKETEDEREQNPQMEERGRYNLRRGSRRTSTENGGTSTQGRRQTMERPRPPTPLREVLEREWQRVAEEHLSIPGRGLDKGGPSSYGRTYAQYTPVNPPAKKV